MTEAALRVIVQDYTDGRIAFRTLANALTDAAMSFHYNRHLAPAGLWDAFTCVCEAEDDPDAMAALRERLTTALEGA